MKPALMERSEHKCGAECAPTPSQRNLDILMENRRVEVRRKFVKAPNVNYAGCGVQFGRYTLRRPGGLP